MPCVSQASDAKRERVFAQQQGRTQFLPLGPPCPATATPQRCWCRFQCLLLPFSAASSAGDCVYSLSPGVSAASQHPGLCPSSLCFHRGPSSVVPHHALLCWFLSELLHSLSGFIAFDLTLTLTGINITAPCVTEPLMSVLWGASLLPAPILLFPSRSTFTGCQGGLGPRC